MFSRRDSGLKYLLAWLPLGAALLAWEAISRFGLVSQVFLPPASRVILTLASMSAGEGLARASLNTMIYCLVGYVAASLGGILLGFIMGLNRVAYLLLTPLVEGLRPIPSAAIIPVAILFLGIDQSMKLAVVTFGSLWPVLLNTLHGVREVDPILLDTGRTLKLTSRQIVTKLVVPAAAPFIFAGLRISLAIALILTVTVEMIAGNSGLGYMILDFERAFKYPHMYAGIMALGVMGWSLNFAFLKLQKLILFWSPKSFDL